jgi:Tol biopolymer transport system component
VKAVDGEAMRQLTRPSDAFDMWPQWSPDGQEILFTRSLRSGTGPRTVMRISALGGPERIVAEESADAAWTPDSRSIVRQYGAADGSWGILRQVLDSDARDELTRVPAGVRDWKVRVSPDGRLAAFMRATGGRLAFAFGRSALFVVPAEGGEPRRLTDWAGGIGGGLAWTPRGDAILYSRPRLGGRQLVRVPVSRHGPVEPVDGVPREAVSPSTSGLRADGTYRLALAHGQLDIGLRMVDLHGPILDGTLTSVAAYCDSTRIDSVGRFSRDGDRVAFVSNRSGRAQIWTARQEGSELRSITSFEDAALDVGSWSPDGRHVTFAATVAENTDVCVVAIDGTGPRRLTRADAAEIDPEWSADGHWIYYATDEPGSEGIWKMRSDGSGERMRLTSGLAYEPRESSDGLSVYLVGEPRLPDPLCTLRRVPVRGGPVQVAYEGVLWGGWDISDAGVVFLTAGTLSDVDGEPDGISLLDFDTGTIRRLGALPFRFNAHAIDRFLIASRDGRWALVPQVDHRDRDVIVLDGLR